MAKAQPHIRKLHSQIHRFCDLLPLCTDDGQTLNGFPFVQEWVGPIDPDFELAELQRRGQVDAELVELSKTMESLKQQREAEDNAVIFLHRGLRAVLDDPRTSEEQKATITEDAATKQKELLVKRLARLTAARNAESRLRQLRFNADNSSVLDEASLDASLAINEANDALLRSCYGLLGRLFLFFQSLMGGKAVSSITDVDSDCLSQKQRRTLFGVGTTALNFGDETIDDKQRLAALDMVLWPRDAEGLEAVAEEARCAAVDRLKAVKQQPQHMQTVNDSCLNAQNDSSMLPAPSPSRSTAPVESQMPSHCRKEEQANVSNPSLGRPPSGRLSSPQQTTNSSTSIATQRNPLRNPLPQQQQPSSVASKPLLGRGSSANSSSGGGSAPPELHLLTLQPPAANGSDNGTARSIADTASVPYEKTPVLRGNQVGAEEDELGGLVPYQQPPKRPAGLAVFDPPGLPPDRRNIAAAQRHEQQLFSELGQLHGRSAQQNANGGVHQPPASRLLIGSSSVHPGNQNRHGDDLRAPVLSQVADVRRRGQQHKARMAGGEGPSPASHTFDYSAALDPGSQGAGTPLLGRISPIIPTADTTGVVDPDIETASGRHQIRSKTTTLPDEYSDDGGAPISAIALLRSKAPPIGTSQAERNLDATIAALRRSKLNEAEMSKSEIAVSRGPTSPSQQEFSMIASTQNTVSHNRALALVGGAFQDAQNRVLEGSTPLPRVKAKGVNPGKPLPVAMQKQLQSHTRDSSPQDTTYLRVFTSERDATAFKTTADIPARDSDGFHAQKILRLAGES